jgi:adenosine/AMP kinase
MQHLLRDGQHSTGGRGGDRSGSSILEVIDGIRTGGVETEEDIAARRALLRRIGYKLG